MKKAIKRIDELQNEVIEKSKTINGADEYVQAKIRLFQENEEARKRVKKIQIKERVITEKFLSTHK
jgi:hypothetical protein